MYEQIGDGGFGTVWKAKSRTDKKMYAIKKILIGTTSTVMEIRNEIELQRKLESKFVVQLYNVFKDSSAYYLQLELAEGGDLFDLITSVKRPFSEDTARFYAAEILCALEYIHGKDIIFRDLKPENILLTKSGHIKIADFGSAMETHSKVIATSYSGSQEYKPPEVVLGKPYNKNVDSWSLGLIIYIMLTKYHPFYEKNPFYANNTFRISENIIKAKIIYDRKYFTMDAEDLLKHLLDRNPVTRYNISQTKNHKWFIAENKTNWPKVENQEVWEKVTGYQLSFIPYINKKVVLGSMDTLCCALFYSWILLRRFHTKNESGNTNGGTNGVVFVTSIASSVTQTNLQLKNKRKTI
ncbi:protein kinase domain-containing protein [Ditylenchus destructor]|uniref:Protein kinase domain-containing protein n=1 Tax=Ditylenchus destructor TaxID=166010 RepID=A0AAD4MNY3_9BILA|nr:protein kinase domain-containing protein [Ditylenchus destructor]